MLTTTMNGEQPGVAAVSTDDTYVIVRPESPGNVWGFWTEADALAAVRDQLARDDAAAVAGWRLVRVPADPDAEWQTVADGDDLLALVAAPGPSAARDAAAAAAGLGPSGGPVWLAAVPANLGGRGPCGRRD
jgi:hypothetical protein